MQTKTTIHPAVNPALEPASISRISTYASCPTKGHLRYKLGARPDHEAGYFWTGHALHRALECYYKREVESVVDGAIFSMLEAFTKANVPKSALDAAVECAGIEAGIIDMFVSGEIVNPKGELYTCPDRTKAYKELAAKRGLYSRLDKLKDVRMGDLDPEENIAKLVARVLILAERYENKLLYPRDKFVESFVETAFDFSFDLPSGREFRFRGFMDLLARDAEGQWYLIDYKSGAAKNETIHAEAAHTSLQLSLYHWVAVNIVGADPTKLKIALHYLDAGYEAVTTRVPEDWTVICQLAEAYLDAIARAPLPQRLFYDSQACVGCDLRASCIAHFGLGTRAAEKFVGEVL